MTVSGPTVQRSGAADTGRTERTCPADADAATSSARRAAPCCQTGARPQTRALHCAQASAAIWLCVAKSRPVNAKSAAVASKRRCEQAHLRTYSYAMVGAHARSGCSWWLSSLRGVAVTRHTSRNESCADQQRGCDWPVQGKRTESSERLATAVRERFHPVAQHVQQALHKDDARQLRTAASKRGALRQPLSPGILPQTRGVPPSSVPLQGRSRRWAAARGGPNRRSTCAGRAVSYLSRRHTAASSFAGTHQRLRDARCCKTNAGERNDARARKLAMYDAAAMRKIGGCAVSLILSVCGGALLERSRLRSRLARR